MTRSTFTRSRSPATLNFSIHRVRTSSPSTPSSRNYPNFSLLPSALQLRLRLPLTGLVWNISIDTRKAIECLLLLGSLIFTIVKLLDPLATRSTTNASLALELSSLIVLSCMYLIWSHTSAQFSPIHLSALKSPPGRVSASVVRSNDNREGRRSDLSLGPVHKKDDFGHLWMSVPKNYRDSSDDGILTGLLVAPIIAGALLYSALRQMKDPSLPTPNSWLIEPPANITDCINCSTPGEALVIARYSLVDLTTFCSMILLFNVCASWWYEAHVRRGIESTIPDSERKSVPRSEAKRLFLYLLFTLGVTLGSLGLKYAFQCRGILAWQYLTYIEVMASAVFYQLTLYVALRLAHRVFTLGELGLVCFGGTALWMELLNITVAKVWPNATPIIKTYRLPTPLLTFQLALIMGSFLTGFLLSPLLVLSRHIAQRPVRRLRFPEEKPRHRRLLAASFYVGTVLVVGGAVGMWTRQCLDSRDPWLWALRWLLEGRKWWTRPLLLTYWVTLFSISLAGWNRQLARSKRYRSATGTGDASSMPIVPESIPDPVEYVHPLSVPNGNASAALGLNFANGANVSHVATELLDAADKRVPTLSLNARRKFFHALAVLMLLPAVVIDPAFAHLSFSIAFAVLTFAEYIRYFALYPFGASVHLFMNEFLDAKDMGTAILSHFYLLIGCASGVWLEGPTTLLQLTGILASGIGDALASIVGKRIGRTRWSPTTSKTLEGSAAFTLSILASAHILRLFGLVESFSTWRYALVVCMSSVLEWSSVQHDNLTVPLYMWSMLALSDVT